MNSFKRIFWNDEQHRLRAPWRLGIQLNLFFIIIIGLAFLTDRLGNGSGMAIISSIVYLVAVLALVFFMARFIDRRSVADFGFHFRREWWIDAVFGLALGAILMTGIFLVEWRAGWVS